MPRSWGSEPYDVPVAAPVGAQAWAPPSGPPQAAPVHAWFASPPTPVTLPGGVPAGPAAGSAAGRPAGQPAPAVVPAWSGAPRGGVHVPAWALVPLTPPAATTPVHVWPPADDHPIFAFEAQPIVVHVPSRPKPRLVGAARWAEALSAALTLLLAAVVVLEVGRRAFVSFAGRPAGAGVDEAMAALLPFVAAAAVGAWVTASVWLGRALRTARDLDPSGAPYPLVFAWVCWLVPLFQLVLPAVLVHDAWNVGTRGRLRSVRPKLGWWWSASLGSVALGGLAAVLTVTTGPGLDPWWLALTTGSVLLLVGALQGWFGVLDGMARALDRP